MSSNLLQIVQVLDGGAPTATGTTEIFSNIIDAADCDGVMFIVRLGSPGADRVVRAQQNTINSASGMADLAGSGKASGSANTIVIDVAFPQERYLRVGVVRTTTTTIDGITAIKYNLSKQPVTQVAATASVQVVAPAEGTAGS